MKWFKVFIMLKKVVDFSPDEIERLCTISAAAGIALFYWRPAEDELRMNGRACKLWGVEDTGPSTFAELVERIVPEDLDRITCAFETKTPPGGEFEINFRVVRKGEIRWLSGRGNHAETATGDRVIVTILFDVTEHERLQERQQMFAAEMDHRVKNSFAIASALTSLVARSAPTVTTMALDLQSRFVALRHAHDLVRPSGPVAGYALLSDLISVLLSPYDCNIFYGKRISMAVPYLLIGGVAATTLALVFHELGTNSVKYGSLSQSEGKLDIVANLEERDVSILWKERGGPPAMPPAHCSGFGTKLIEKSLAFQLGGSSSFIWGREGLTANLRANRSMIMT